MSELLYRMAMTRLMPMASREQRIILNELGCATEVYAHRHELHQLLSRSAWRVADALADMDSVLGRCQAEIDYCRSHNISILTIGDDDYPARLAQADDAPLVLYALGRNARQVLNAPHVVSVVGTRRCTEAGRQLCTRFAAELQQLLPDTVIISGLAYGIDIAAHRGALQAGLPTVAVLAHGLDQIYPRMHRDTAVQMLQQGGLLTEYMSQTTPDKVNFVQRNRIVAALADVVLVVESAAKGGSLITANMAFDYGRDVCAFPGRVTDAASAGCNMLIRSTRAALVQSAADLIETMRWQPQTSASDGIQTELLPQLTGDQQAIINALRDTDEATLTDICTRLQWPVTRVMPLLFEMEMKGLLLALPGNRYKSAATPQLKV